MNWEGRISVRIVGIEGRMTLCCLPLESFVAVPIVLVRNHGIEKGKAEILTGLRIAIVRALLLAFIARHLQILRIRLSPPKGLSDKHETSRPRHLGQRLESALVAPEDPGSAYARRHVKALRFVRGSVHMKNLDTLCQSPGLDILPGLRGREG